MALVMEKAAKKIIQDTTGHVSPQLNAMQITYLSGAKGNISTVIQPQRFEKKGNSEILTGSYSARGSLTRGTNVLTESHMTWNLD